jgi:LysM repeat protein
MARITERIGRRGRLRLAGLLLVSGLNGIAGCVPVGYVPPPQWPAGQTGYPPAVQPPATFVTPASPALAIPQQNPATLKDVPAVPAQDVLRVPQTTKSNTWHEVQPGESLPVIARKYGVTVEALLKANVLDSAATVQPGMQLLIP